MPTDISSHRHLGVTYTQSDVDMIREQILQTESSKRRSLAMGLTVSTAALTGAVILLLIAYGLYFASESSKQQLAEENASLKAKLEQSQKQLDETAAKEAESARTRADAQSQLESLLPGVLRSTAGGSEVASFARMVYNLPQSRVEIDHQPPNTLFRNWRATSGSTTETYTLVGGFVDGKWVIYSNLIAKR